MFPVQPGDTVGPKDDDQAVQVHFGSSIPMMGDDWTSGYVSLTYYYIFDNHKKALDYSNNWGSNE